MGQKSLKVPQPDFSNWIIQKRQELNLAPASLKEKLEGKLSEHTLNVLAQGLDMSYADLLRQIEALRTETVSYIE